MRDIASAAAIEFEALDDFLMSDYAPEGCMRLGQIDGFLAGIAVSPDFILPAEWLPVIWGGGEPDFEDAGAIQHVVSTLMLRYAGILLTLGQQPDKYRPIRWGAAGGSLLLEDWADGFMTAISMRDPLWDMLWRLENFHLVAPIVVFACDEQGRPYAGDDERRVAEIREGMLHFIPDAVVAIHRFWQAGPKDPPLGPPATVTDMAAWRQRRRRGGS